jgi:predicted transcriptional regulator
MRGVSIMMSQTTKSVEEFLCSKTRMNIIKLLHDLGQLNVSDVAHRLHMNYETTMRHLRILEDSKIIEQRVCERTRSLDSAVQKVLEAWEKEVIRARL